MPFKMNYIGFLTNVDKSILNIKLKHGFTIKREPMKEIINLISRLDKVNEDKTSKLIYSKARVNSEELDIEPCVYCVRYSYRDDQPNIFKVHIKYLKQIFRLIRLFTGGNINISLEYTFFENNKILTRFHKFNFSNPLPRCSFTLNSSEIPQLQKFINNTDLPFKTNFLQLAFENFELSYTVNNINIQFLVLMNGMEVLFHPSDKGELTYRISRNAAVLLGKNKDNGKEIQKKMKRLYSQRSKIVHNGKADILDKELSELRNYLKDSIIGFYKLQDKDHILNLLNISGFGDSPIKNL